MKNARNSQSQRWLYIIIIAIVLITIASILIINSTKPKESSDGPEVRRTDSSKTDSKKESSNSNKQDSSTTTESDIKSDSPSEPAPSSSSPTSTAPSYTPVSQPVEHKCYHEEAGVCWDDLENDAYSAGLYDHEYDYYGASYSEPDNCDAICRDILEDAYEEGWADGA